MKNTFKTLFGITSDLVQKTCVIMPFDIPGAARQLGVAALTKGRLYAAGQGQGLTLIRSGMGAGFVGDAVLWLKETPCEQIFFLGTCGLVERTPRLDIGTIVTPERIFAFESFSAIMHDHMPIPAPLTADQRPLKDTRIERCSCISFPSLHEEERHLPLFKSLNAQVIEMETSAFFLAAQRITRPAAAILVISDIIGEKTFCFDLAQEHKKSLANGISQACQTIMSLSV